jgi:hypothetical protein
MFLLPQWYIWTLSGCTLTNISKFSTTHSTNFPPNYNDIQIDRLLQAYSHLSTNVHCISRNRRTRNLNFNRRRFSTEKSEKYRNKRQIIVAQIKEFKRSTYYATC